MPQGTWLGPLIFIVLIKDLSTSCMLHEFINDSILCKFLKKGETNMIDVYFNNAVVRSRDNLMNTNCTKTKEMLLGTVDINEKSQLIVDGNIITRVSVFKLLGLYVESNLKWCNHNDYIYAKASSRLYFL